MNKKLLTAIPIIILIGLIIYFKLQSPEEQIKKGNNVVTKERVVSTLTINKNTFVYYELPSNKYAPQIDRDGYQDLICIVNNTEKTWKYGSKEKPFKNFKYSRIGFKLPKDFTSMTKKIYVTYKKR